MTLESMMAALAIVALLTMLVDILDVKFKFFSKKAESINAGIFGLSIVMIFCFWVFSIATVEVAQ